MAIRNVRNTHFGKNIKKDKTLEPRLIFWISSERISNGVCKLCECWAVICIGECKLRSAFPSFTVVASRVGAPGISPKINGGPVEQAFPSVKHKRFSSISRARVRAVGPKIKGGPVQQAFPSGKYKRFLYLKGGKVCMQMAEGPFNW